MYCRDFASELARDYGIGMHTICDIMNISMTLMIQDLQQLRSENVLLQKVDAASFSGSTRSKQKKHQHLLPHVHGKPSTCMNL